MWSMLYSRINTEMPAQCYQLLYLIFPLSWAAIGSFRAIICCQQFFSAMQENFTLRGVHILKKATVGKLQMCLVDVNNCKGGW